jgi:hypothetical protein
MQLVTRGLGAVDEFLYHEARRGNPQLYLDKNKHPDLFVSGQIRKSVLLRFALMARRTAMHVSSFEKPC